MQVADKFKKQTFKINLQGRLVAGFVIATFLTGFVATVMSIRTINRSTIDEVQNRVRQDINSAKLIYNNTLLQISSLIQFAAEGQNLQEVIAHRDIRKMESLTALVRPNKDVAASDTDFFLDMLTLVDVDGKVLYRAAHPESRGDNIFYDQIVKKCILTKAPVTSTELLPIEDIIAENPSLSKRVNVDILKTPLSVDIEEKKLSNGLVMRAAYPIMDKSKNLVGVLVGGNLLNNDFRIVDQIKATVYQGEKYKGRDIGVATIFQGGVRISTNVMTKENKRAIGTILSKEVYDQVILEGKDWVGRAFVVDDWYITTYTPIFNMNRKLVGVLYVGLLESKYRDIKWRTIAINMGITALGMVLAFIISFRFGNTIITRIRMLKEASEAVASGNLDYKLSPDRISGFDMLDEAFNNMSKSLKDRDDRLQKMHERIIRTERLTALGEMAAGVAHEINNPLGGILLYSSLVLEDISENSPARDNVLKIVSQTNRCKEIVQNLLDFARTPTVNMTPLKINDIIMTALKLVQDQTIFLNVDIETRLDKNDPEVIGDMTRLEEVFVNLFINAADAMDGKGTLTITTALRTNNSIRITISDTGKGIDRETMPHIFEPFFTTKEPGRGTGLGLSIAYGIISRHNGIIEAESEADKGTTFIISLPLMTDSATDQTQNRSEIKLDNRIESDEKK